MLFSSLIFIYICMYVCVCIYVYIHTHIYINVLITFFILVALPTQRHTKKTLYKKVIFCDKWKGGVQFNNCFPQSQ